MKFLENLKNKNNMKRTFRKYNKEAYIEYELRQEKLNTREGSLKNKDIPLKVIGKLIPLLIIYI